MKSIKSVKNLKGKRVLVRVDFNVPIEKGKVQDTFRIKKALPTIKYLKQKGAKIILLSHLGGDGTESLDPVATSLKQLIKFTFVRDIDGITARNSIEKMKNGEIILLENIRQNPSEVTNFEPFDRSLASLADIYVNEAFPESHRAYASIVGVPKYLPHYAGLQLEAEVKNLQKVLKPKHPFLFILGGAKFSTKLPLLQKYLKSADNVFVGGALANNFFRARGIDVKKSLVDEDDFGISELMKNKKLITPDDFLMKDEKIVDISMKSIEALLPLVKKAKLIVWNGPMGEYEAGYDAATIALLKMISKSKAETIIGGGDTAALVDKLKMGKKFTFVSTGGGATLDFLADGTLVGIEALK